MVLTNEQKAELAAIVAGARYGRSWTDEMRGGDKWTYRPRRDSLTALNQAWQDVDLETQLALVAALALMSREHASATDAPTPDLGAVIQDHLQGIALQNGSPERTYGFRDAILFLWNVWCAEQPLDCEPSVGNEVLEFIAPIVAEMFDMPLPEARRKAYNRLRACEKTEAGLPRRKGHKGRPFH